QPGFADISGTATPAQLPVATTSALGVVEPDGTTITIAAGVISAVGGGSGGIVLLETKTASASAELDFLATFSSAHRNYRLLVNNVFPATDRVSLYIQFSTNGGATWDTTSANYTWSRSYYAVNYTDNGAQYDQSTAGLELWDTDLHNAGVIGLSADFTIFYDPTGTNNLTMIGHVIGNNTVPRCYFIHYAELYTGAGVINAMRIIASSGNLTSGSVATYGYA
ncbi:MAG: hypothetical protein RB191_24480, partial [Terriglobia bacterium]|nr:hypothetical protein [Terriglobia bacterium]